MSTRRTSKLGPPEGLTTADWAGANGERWSSVADHLEAQLAPVGDLLHEQAAIRPGEAVLDVGCGRGATTRRAATAAGPTGSVTGIDVAANLIEEARRSASDELGIDWVVGDAQRHELPPAALDVVISRFGVMFFDDALTAFANLRRATSPSGRLCVVVWQARDRSPLMQHPLDVAQRAAQAHGVTLDFGPVDAGAFAWSAPDVVVPVLEGAGWRDVVFAPHTLAMYNGGPGPVERIVQTSLTVGSLPRALAEQPPDLVDAVRAALVADFGERHDGTGVRLDGAVAVVRARA